MDTIHIITAVHNRRMHTERFVKAILAEEGLDVRLILVDDGSTDGTAEVVRTLMPTATILQGNGNLWWGGALHLAYRHVKAHLAERGQDIIMIANDDILFSPGYLATGCRLVREHPKTLIAGCGYGLTTGLLTDGAYRRDFTHILPEDEGYRPAFTDGDVASSRSLFFTVGDFLAIGGFHPILLPHYASDYEWTARATRKGYRIRMDESLAYRYDDAATGDNFYATLTRRKLFSKRSASNPFYKISYILLSTPKQYLLSELVWQMKRYLGKRATIREILKR